MSNRHDEGFGSGFGSGYDPYLDWEGPNAIRGGAFRDRTRRTQFDDEMGSTPWSGYGGRANVADRFYERNVHERGNGNERVYADRFGGWGNHPYERNGGMGIPYDRNGSFYANPNIGIYGSAVPWDRNVTTYGAPYERGVGTFGGPSVWDRHMGSWNPAIGPMATSFISPYDRSFGMFGGVAATDRGFGHMGHFGYGPTPFYERTLAATGSTPYDRLPWTYTGATPWDRNVAPIGTTAFAGSGLFANPFGGLPFGAIHHERSSTPLGVLNPWERFGPLLGASPFGNTAGAFGGLPFVNTPYERPIGAFGGLPFVNTPYERSIGAFGGLPFANTPYERPVGAFGGLPFGTTPHDRYFGPYASLADRTPFIGTPWERNIALFGTLNPYSPFGTWGNGRDEREFGELSQGWYGSLPNSNYGPQRTAFFGRDRNPFFRGESYDWTAAERYGAFPESAPYWGNEAIYGVSDGPYYGRGPKGYKRPDDRIREEICEVVARQGFIDATDVEVLVESGVVRLVGSVPQRRDKRGLEHLIERVYGVEEIRNELRLNREHSAERFQSRIGERQVSVQPHNGKNARA